MPGIFYVTSGDKHRSSSLQSKHFSKWIFFWLSWCSVSWDPWCPLWSTRNTWTASHFSGVLVTALQDSQVSTGVLDLTLAPFPLRPSCRSKAADSPPVCVSFFSCSALCSVVSSTSRRGPCSFLTCCEVWFCFCDWILTNVSRLGPGNGRTCDQDNQLGAFHQHASQGDQEVENKNEDNRSWGIPLSPKFELGCFRPTLLRVEINISVLKAFH